MHTKNILTGGQNIEDASKVLILLHGRGATAGDILGLSHSLNVEDYAVLAPQATNYTWYPYSFLAKPSDNEPWLSSALRLLNDVVADLNETGIVDENIYFAGFSQGACLTLEFVTRNARKWGGVAAFTGGLIGDKIYREHYKGKFDNTPIFIGSSDPDPHVPVARVRETVRVLKEMGANVTEKIYLGMGHTVIDDEIRRANEIVFR